MDNSSLPEAEFYDGPFGRGLKRLFDIVIACVLLIIVSPLLLLAIIGIIMSSSGPIFYPAQRVGRFGKTFKMYKFRTMSTVAWQGSKITAPQDSRIFPFGAILRKFKIDELPQFLNIIKGDMSVIGPRPEDPSIVDKDYAPWMKETLLVRPGITSPGAIFGYLYADDYLDPDDPEQSYLDHVLIPKLALERAYLERAKFLSDLRYLVLTVVAIGAIAIGTKINLPKIDTDHAKKWL